MNKIFLTLSIFTCFSLCANEEFAEQDKYRIAKKIQDIVIKAKKDWPENYTIQLSIIKNQTESMLEMEQLSKQMKIPL